MRPVEIANLVLAQIEDNDKEPWKSPLAWSDPADSLHTQWLGIIWKSDRRQDKSVEVPNRNTNPVTPQNLEEIRA